MEKRYLYDTNALLKVPHHLDTVDSIVIPYHVLQELDKIKTERSARGYQARVAVRKLKSLGSKVRYDLARPINNIQPLLLNNDDMIIKSAVDNKCIIVTGDFLVQLKAKAQGLEVEDLEIDVNEIDHSYSGIKELFLDPNNEKDSYFIAQFYESNNNFIDLCENEYVILWDKTKPTYDNNGILKGYNVIDKFKFNGEKIAKLKYKSINNMYTGQIKPLNIKQECMFDMMQDKNTTVKSSFGSFGVGKDFVMISHAIDLLISNKVNKLIWVRNNVEVKDSNPIGFLPSDLESKLLPFAMPLADHLGGITALENMLSSGKIEIQHLGFIRGRDIKDSIVYVTECENNTRQHIQLLLGRIGEGSQLWLNGDTRQIDEDKFINNNGVTALKMLKGNKLYGQVTLDKTERSETAKLADLLDF
jgi:PhoH-like ATPase